MLNWGIIGGGSVVRTKSGPAFNVEGRSRIYSIYRRNIDEARETASELGATTYFSNLDDFIGQTEIDAVYIATPPGLHLEHAQKACAARLPTYIEKPFARNLSEAKAICELYDRAKVPLFIAHYRRAIDRFIKLRELTWGGSLGKPLAIDFRLERRNADFPLSGWMADVAVSGGGKFFDIAPHVLDVVTWIFGELSQITSVVKSSGLHSPYEDIVSVSFSSASGVVGSSLFFLCSQNKQDRLTVLFEHGEINLSIHGDETIEVKGPNGKEQLKFPKASHIQTQMIHEVISWLEGNPANICSGHEALTTMAAMDQILDHFYRGRNRPFWLDCMNGK